ncbi:MAG: hypothetical protein QM715_20135 [Nibricoccus sp.]
MDSWKTIQRQEELGFWYILIFASLISWVLVRWKKGLFAPAAPLVALLSWFACSNLTYVLSESDGRYWHRGFPDYQYIALGISAALIPVLSCGLAFFLPRRVINQPPCSKTDPTTSA